MNVIFLDIDGVLCHHRVSVAYGEKGLMRTLDPVGLAMIRRLCSMFDMKVVISSTWRREGHDFVRSCFCAAGYPDLIPLDSRIWCTDTKGKTRGDEIERYILDHDVDKYLIIDDDSDFYEYQKKFHIKTDGLNGLMYDHFKQAAEIMGKKESEI